MSPQSFFIIITKRALRTELNALKYLSKEEKA